jgi:D-hexose-6-phosphate mutarotase
MSDLADDAFRRFVCVETANAADDVVSVPAGETRTLQTRFVIR